MLCRTRNATDTACIHIMAFKFRKCFSILRYVTAPLRIETGRYERLPVEQRVCEVCDSDNVEDEMHFLISGHTLQIEFVME